MSSVFVQSHSFWAEFDSRGVCSKFPYDVSVYPTEECVYVYLQYRVYTGAPHGLWSSVSPCVVVYIQKMIIFVILKNIYYPCCNVCCFCWFVHLHKIYLHATVKASLVPIIVVVLLVLLILGLGVVWLVLVLVVCSSSISSRISSNSSSTSCSIVVWVVVLVMILVLAALLLVVVLVLEILLYYYYY